MKILSFVAQSHPALPQEHTDRKTNIQTGNLLLLSHRKGKSLEDIFITARFSGQKI